DAGVDLRDGICDVSVIRIRVALLAGEVEVDARHRGGAKSRARTACGLAPSRSRERSQRRPKSLKRPGAMAQRVFHDGAELAERAVILRNQEQRVVAEAAGAAGFADDDAVTATFDDGFHIARRIR